MADDPWWHDVAAVAALVRTGWSPDAVDWRVRTGRWQRPARGVVCRTSGQLATEQRHAVALTYAGDGAMLSHESAGAFWGMTPDPPRVRVTTPHGRHRRSNPLVDVRQSRRPVEPRLLDDRLVTPPARTAIDIACGLPDLDAVRALLGKAVQRRLVTVDSLADELELAPSRGSLLPRQALDEVARGAHSASEGRFLRLVERAGLPVPELNAPVETCDGIKYVDALWRRLGKGVELDGLAYHLDPRSWAGDLSRQNAIQLAGIVLLRIAAARLWRDPAGVLTELGTFVT